MAERRAWAALLFAFAGCCHANEPLTLKGIAPGMSESEILAIHPQLECRWIESRYACSYTTQYAKSKSEALSTLAGAPVTSWVVLMGAGRARSILVVMGTKSFEDVRGAMVERYGAPSSEERSVVKNRMGAEFDQVSSRWLIGDRSLRVEKRGGKISDMAVHLTSKEALEEAQRDKVERTKKGAKDL